MKPYFEGLDSYSEGTFDCDREGCFYHQYGRCIYNIAPIKIRTSRGCYEELMQDYYDCMADYEMGWM